MNRPLVPEDVPGGIRRARPAVYLYRAAAAHVHGLINHITPERAAKQLFGNDVVTAEVLRATSAMATTGSASWAGALAQTAVDDSVMALTTLSAAAGLIQRGLR